METTKKLKIFLIITFASSWILQIIGSLSKNGYVYSFCLAAVCFLPLIAVAVVSHGLSAEKSGLGWSFEIGKHWRWYLSSFILSAAVVAICCAVFFLVFPSKFDVNCGYYKSFFAEDSDLRNINALDFVIIEILSSWFLRSFMNIFIFAGQEAGFRGYLVPLLSEKLGKKKAIVVSGLLFGAYRFPVIALAGYEYGENYFLYPVSGFAAHLIYAVAISIFLSFIYSKTESVWFSALAIGTVNALSPCAVYFLGEEPVNTLLGPALTGLIPALVLLVLAVLLLSFADFEPKTPEDTSAYRSPFGRLR